MLSCRNIFRRFVATSQCHHCSVFRFAHLCSGSKGFSGGSLGKESTCNAGDVGLIPGLGRLPRGRHGSPLQDSCLENPMDRGAWRAAVHGVTESETWLKRLGARACMRWG